MYMRRRVRDRSWLIAPLLAALVAGCPADEGKLNGSAALRWNGAVDLDVNFSEFFGGNHTIAFRFMSQYPYGPAGPMLAENGAGTFFVGHGDYRWGSGGFKTAGDPVLYVQVGSATRTYEVADLEPERWEHLAIVRDGNQFKLYLNGTHVAPDISATPATPTGNLRIGRRTDGQNVAAAGYPGQFYGFVDDVAIFTRALSASEIAALMNSDLTGQEADLLAGWKFDFAGQNAPALPAPLQRAFTPAGTAYRAVVSELRDSAFDAKLLPKPELGVTLQLPFEAGSHWRVLQGMNVRDGSHNGFAAFCFDFVRADLPDSTGQPLYAVADATITSVIEGSACSDPSAPGNIVNMRFAQGLFGAYLHNEQGSYANGAGAGTLFLPQFLPDNSRPKVSTGDYICNVGSTGIGNCNGAHLHIALGTTNDQEAGFVTFPLAFSNYEVSTDAGQTWQSVGLGIPQDGEWVRLPTN